MANSTRAYTISFESDTHVTDIAIIPFLTRIEELMNSDREKILRRINGKLMRIHPYEWGEQNRGYLVIPFGKLKESNKPYGMDENTQRLIDLPLDMFDVNCLAYHLRYNIALLTTNQLGPSDDDIEHYLNSYIPQDAEYRIKMNPIKINTGIEKVRNATQARSVTFSLDLGRPLNDFFRDEIVLDQGISAYMNGLINYSKNTLDSKTFSITLGLGKLKKASLDVGALLELLESINIDSNCVKEITVNCKDNRSIRFDTAKLKDKSISLLIYFDIKASRLGAEYIKINLEDKLTKERPRYYHQIEEYFRDCIHVEGGYHFVEEWEELPVV